MRARNENNIPDIKSAVSRSTINDNEFCCSVLQDLGCEKTVGVYWDHWDRETIPPHFFDKVKTTSKVIFDNRHASVLCSMLAIALNQDFGDELFHNVGAVGKEHDGNTHFLLPSAHVRFLYSLFHKIPYIADLDSNKCAKSIYCLLKKYANIKCGTCDNMFFKEVFLQELMTFTYVFYARLIHDLFLNRKKIDRGEAAKLFADIYCSPTMYDYMHMDVVKYAPNLKYNKELIKKGETNFVFKRDIEFSFDKALLYDTGEDKKREKEIHDFIDRIFGESVDNIKPIIDSGRFVDISNLKYWADKNLSFFYDFFELLNWLLDEKIYVIELPELSLEKENMPDIYKFLSEKSKALHNKRVIDIDAVEEYFEKIIEDEYSEEALLWFVLKSGLLILSRNQMSLKDSDYLKRKFYKEYFAVDDNNK